MKNKFQLLFFFLTLIATNHLFAQSKIVSGKVTDGSVPIPGVSVAIRGTTTGTITSPDGSYSITVPSNDSKLSFSYIGYATQLVDVGSQTEINIVLVENSQSLSEVVVSVGRGSERTLTDSPLPVDIISTKDLTSTGQATFDKALQYKVPSFNTVNTPVNDATSLFDPYELRNLGPSRTLILINGKRKNLTSLVYTATSPGRGETGADISAIPTDAIKRVEILRDGASAQYGSDAIAGVMNIILKDSYESSNIRLTSGVTSKGDGFNYGVNYNSGANFGEKGFINYNIAFLRQERAVRSGTIDPVAEISPVVGFGGDATTDQNIQSFLSKNPDGKNVNGTTDNTSAKFLINAGIPLSKRTELYGNAAYVYRRANSYANFRQPYWKKDYGLLHTPDPNGVDYTGSTDANEIALYKGYVGYQPTFEGDLNDYNGTLGLKTLSETGWKQDMSLTVGGNKMLFSVNNTVNHSLAGQSPVSFKPGGFSFKHIVGNIDISKNVTEKLFIGFGSEFRTETYEEIAGDTASYSGQGANSFPGYSTKNAIIASRYNLGAYIDLGYDVSDSWFVGLTGRSEKYSDFGNANVGKFSTRLKIADGKVVLRASISNGFKAPTLHQSNLALNQAVGLSSGGVTIQGLANNHSREAALLGIPKLKAEKSINFTAGLGLTPSDNFTITLDYYYVDIKDRIVYSSLVKPGVSPTLDALLASVNSTGVSFFVNGAHTRTQGLDIVASYRNIKLGTSTLNLNLAGNYVINNDLVGSINTPALIADAGGSIFTKTEEALMLTSRPKYKFILGGELVVGKFNFNLNNSLVGPAYFSNVAYADFGQLDHLRTTFSTRLLTDLSIAFEVNKRLSISATASNILNQYPKWKIEALDATGTAFLQDGNQTRLLMGDLTFNGRYSHQTYDGSHISQLGTTFLGQLNYKF